MGGQTLLAMLLGLVPPTERIVVMEDAAELRPMHPHVVALYARTGNGEDAGRSVCPALVRQALLVGTGDNGGDALLAGALLRRRGVSVEALLIGGSAHQRGLVRFLGAYGRMIRVRDAESVTTAEALLAQADLVLDGIVGISGRPGLTEPSARLGRVS